MRSAATPPCKGGEFLACVACMRVLVIQLPKPPLDVPVQDGWASAERLAVNEGERARRCFEPQRGAGIEKQLAIIKYMRVVSRLGRIEKPRSFHDNKRQVQVIEHGNARQLAIDVEVSQSEIGPDRGTSVTSMIGKRMTAQKIFGVEVDA